MAKLAPLSKKDLPKPLALKKLIGPSFILLGLGLGSGELILWPYLTSNFGMGVIWAAVLGITFQFFLNMEIERYTIVTGESIFVGLTRRFGFFSPIWFIFSTLIPWLWPGIVAASATAFAAAIGIGYSSIFGISLLLLIGILYSLGNVIYKTQEKIQKLIILVGVPFIFLVTLYLSKLSDWQALAAGLIGKGDRFWFLPSTIPIATFLGAFAYAGAGGNLNLAQSLYAKEKGYGMGKFSGRITNVLKGLPAGRQGKVEKVTLEGATFECNKKNIANYKTWWRRLNIEHGIVFWLTGAITMVLLALLAFSTVYGDPGVETSINFVIHEGKVIAESTFPFLGTFFLIMAGIMLFGTQFSVFGSTARIMAENLVILSPEKFKIKNLPKYFFSFLWLQILSGIAVFAIGFTEPLTLVITSAVLNAMSMFVYSGMVLLLNVKNLEKPLQPSLIRKLVVGFAFLFYGFFSIFTIIQKLSRS